PLNDQPADPDRNPDSIHNDDRPLHQKMDTSSDNPSDDVLVQRAAAPLSELLKADESKKSFLNRLRFYLNSSFPESFKSIRLSSTDLDSIVIVTFKHDDSPEFANFLKSPHDDLKITDSSPSPIFHTYDIDAAKADYIA